MLEAARTADRLDKLAAILAKEGLMPTNGKGDPIAHPALVEAPQQQLALGRTLNSLRIPASGEEGWDDYRGFREEPSADNH